MATLASADGSLLPGFLDDSAGPGAPAVLLLHEWWGVNAQLRGVAERLGQSGFQAFAADLYRGTLPKDAAEAEAAMQALDGKRALADLHAAVQALLPRSGGRVGALGFCMGGAYALAAAARNPEVKAVVAYYGIPREGLVDVAAIQGKVLGHFATRDGHVSKGRVDALQKTLQEAKVPFTLYRYEADHAFANEKRPEVYAPAAAELAWSRTLAFLHQELGGASALQ